MKYLRIIIVMLLSLTVPSIGNAQKSNQKSIQKNDKEGVYFFKYREQSGAEYAYLSPLMLKTMKLTDQDLEGFPADKVESVEILSLKWDASNLLNSKISTCIEENGMELVGAITDKEKKTSNSIYAKMEGDNKIKKLLILKWGPWFNSIKLLYITGNFTINDLKDKL